MVLLNLLGILAATVAYLGGLWRWIYHGKLWFGLASIFLIFPGLIFLTADSQLLFLRGLPLAGVVMFLHRYGSRILMQVKLLWFTTLSVLVVQGYYMLLIFMARH